MATQDVPGANPANADTLHAGCWCQHEDGSLLYVKGAENDQVIYELYDLAQDPPVYYQDAMRKEAFKKAFSHPPVGNSKEKWIWHDKLAFPWNKVMKTFDKPRPVHADVHDTLSAAARVAESLRLRAQELKSEETSHMAEQEGSKAGMDIVKRIQKAFDVLING